MKAWSSLDVQQVSEDRYTVASGASDALHEVSVVDKTCSCTTFLRTGLLCRHFLAECVASMSCNRT